MPGNEQLFIQNAMTQLEHRIRSSALDEPTQDAIVQRLHAVDATLIEQLCNNASHTLTAVNISYLYMFLAGVDTQTVALIFHIEPGTVYTIRYRLRASFRTDTMLPF